MGLGLVYILREIALIYKIINLISHHYQHSITSQLVTDLIELILTTNATDDNTLTNQSCRNANHSWEEVDMFSWLEWSKPPLLSTHHCIFLGQFFDEKVIENWINVTYWFFAVERQWVSNLVNFTDTNDTFDYAIYYSYLAISCL